MGKNTEISWTDHTWNPWQGCHKTSPGCNNCYMFRDKKRFGQDPSTVIKSAAATFDKPMSWKEPAMVFTCSWSDFFIEEADPWRYRAWDIIRHTPHLTYQILTKRPERISACLPGDWPLENVWLGVTAENQEQFNERVPYLLFDIHSVKRFVSVEPMLGPVDAGSALCEAYINGGFTMGRYLDWVICGGESGPNARDMDAVWAAALLDQCKSTNTPFFMKQMSGVNPRKIPIPYHLDIKEFPKTTTE